MQGRTLLQVFTREIDLPWGESFVETNLPYLQLFDTKEHEVNLNFPGQNHSSITPPRVCSATYRVFANRPVREADSRPQVNHSVGTGTPSFKGKLMVLPPPFAVGDTECMQYQTVRFFSFLFVVSFGFAVTPAHATSYLYAASGYNVFVQSSITFGGPDTQGSVAAGGNVSASSGTSFASLAGNGPYAGGTYALVTGGKFLPTGSGNIYGN